MADPDNTDEMCKGGWLLVSAVCIASSGTAVQALGKMRVAKVRVGSLRVEVRVATRLVIFLTDSQIVR